VLLANRCVVLAPFNELLKFFDRLSGSEKSERVSVFNDFDDTIKTRSDSVVSLFFIFEQKIFEIKLLILEIEEYS